MEEEEEEGNERTMKMQMRCSGRRWVGVLLCLQWNIPFASSQQGKYEKAVIHHTKWQNGGCLLLAAMPTSHHLVAQASFLFTVARRFVDKSSFHLHQASGIDLTDTLYRTNRLLANGYFFKMVKSSGHSALGDCRRARFADSEPEGQAAQATNQIGLHANHFEGIQRGPRLYIGRRLPWDVERKPLKQGCSKYPEARPCQRIEKDK